MLQLLNQQIKMNMTMNRTHKHYFIEKSYNSGAPGHDLILHQPLYNL